MAATNAVDAALKGLFPKLNLSAPGAAKFRMLIAQAIEAEVAKARAADKAMLVKLLKAEALKETRTAVGITQAIKIVLIL